MGDDPSRAFLQTECQPITNVNRCDSDLNVNYLEAIYAMCTEMGDTYPRDSVHRGKAVHPSPQERGATTNQHGVLQLLVLRKMREDALQPARKPRR